MSGRALALAVALMLPLVGCIQPRQRDTLVRVDHGGLASRMQVLCSLGIGSGAAQQSCYVDQEQAERLQSRAAKRSAAARVATATRPIRRVPSGTNRSTDLAKAPIRTHK